MTTRNKPGARARRAKSPYHPSGHHSFFRDLLTVAVADRGHSADPGARGSWEATAFHGDRDSDHHGGVQDARNRLSLHSEAEARDLSTAATAGGGFVPASGGWLGELFGEVARDEAVVAKLLPQRVLPKTGMDIRLPIITTGPSATVQASEGAAASETDIVEAAITAPVVTISSTTDLSMQLLERSDPGVDAVLAVESARAIAEALDDQIIAGSGSSGQLDGLTGLTGVNAHTATDASPTIAETTADVYEAASAHVTAFGRKPNALILHPRRSAWFKSSPSLDAKFETYFKKGVVESSSISTTNGSGSNVGRYEVDIRRRLKPLLGDTRVTDLTVDDVARLISRMRDDGYAAWTVRAALTPLRGAFKWAVRRGHVASNPVERLERGELPRTSRREMRLLDSEELALLLESAEGVYRVLLATAAFTGSRLGELLGFTWRDVDFDRGRISVRCQLRGGERVEPKTPQAKREIVLMPSLALMLKEHKASSHHCADKDFVFTSLEGAPLTPTNARRRGLEKAAKRAGLDSEDLPKLRFHDLRHLHASLLIADGMDVVFVSRMLGHADPSITLEVYAHLWDAHRHGEALTEKFESGYGVLVGKLMENRNGPQPPDTASTRNAEVVDLQALRQ